MITGSLGRLYTPYCRPAPCSDVYTGWHCIMVDKNGQMRNKEFTQACSILEHRSQLTSNRLNDRYRRLLQSRYMHSSAPRDTVLPLAVLGCFRLYLAVILENRDYNRVVICCALQPCFPFSQLCQKSTRCQHRQMWG